MYHEWNYSNYSSIDDKTSNSQEDSLSGLIHGQGVTIFQILTYLQVQNFGWDVCRWDIYFGYQTASKLADGNQMNMLLETLLDKHQIFQSFEYNLKMLLIFLLFLCK